MNDRPAATHSSPHIPFPESGAYPVRPGNHVRPLIDGEATLRRIAEAVDAAERSVWVTVAFLSPAFLMPDGRGSLFDELDRAAARGLDVRVIFWRNNPESAGFRYVFAGSEADRAMLRARDARFRIRWDRVNGVYCHHQKSWLIDAGLPSETAFVGGINLTEHAMTTPGHLTGSEFHDLYLEVAGPSATDVHHNFVQRWNEASERHRVDGLWGHGADDVLPFPERVSGVRGESLVQIQRSIPAGLYTNPRATPGGRSHAIAEGERSILDQYLLAIDAARRSIYLEHQSIAIEPILARLDVALERGVEVVCLVPGVPEDHVRKARHVPERKPQFDRLAALARHPHFTLAGMAVPRDGGRADVYVHAKAMLVDDAWATIGSSNLHAFSLFGHTELNASFWAPEVVRALRCELLAEHLGEDTGGLDDVAALRLYREIAAGNRRRRDRGDAAWRGLAYRLDPATYGES